MTMIEKVARAMQECERKRISENIAMSLDTLYLNLARAAIEALRDPTPEMCQRGGRFIGLSPGDNHSMRLAFVDMLDTALKEE